MNNIEKRIEINERLRDLRCKLEEMKDLANDLRADLAREMSKKRTELLKAVSDEGMSDEEKHDSMDFMMFDIAECYVHDREQLRMLTRAIDSIELNDIDEY